jgi:hypothetical protein
LAALVSDRRRLISRRSIKKRASPTTPVATASVFRRLKWPTSGETILAINLLFALFCLGLLSLDFVQVEAALTNGEMLPLNVTDTNVGP